MFYRNRGKRIFDLISSFLLILLFSPLIIIIAFMVRQRLGSPILFRQQRPGYLGKPFTIYKFRSMTNARFSSGELLPDSERLTRFGRFLRSASLDELPELFNVLKGDMSMVGPRPLLTEYLKHYTKEQIRRHDVRPGFTGWAQINGRNLISWEEKFALDIWYVDNITFRLDLQILLRTIAWVIKREGISHPGQATMEKFSGNNGKTGDGS